MTIRKPKTFWTCLVLFIVGVVIAVNTCNYPLLLKVNPDNPLFNFERLHAGWHYNLWRDYSASGQEWRKLK